MVYQRILRKGDLSLETVVQFTIVLIVVLVVSVFVYRIVPTEPPRQNIQTETQIENKCQTRCIDFQTANNEEEILETALDYCAQRYTADIKNNDQIGMVERDYMSFCEDGIRCFHVTECSSNGIKLDAETCSSKMCEYYTEIEGMDQCNAEEHIRDTLFKDDFAEGNSGIGTCGLEAEIDLNGLELETWLKHFRGKLSCGDGMCVGATPS